MINMVMIFLMIYLKILIRQIKKAPTDTITCLKVLLLRLLSYGVFEQMKEFGIPERNIRCDKSTGKNFNRREYNALVGTETTAPLLRKGDLLIIRKFNKNE